MKPRERAISNPRWRRWLVRIAALLLVPLVVLTLWVQLGLVEARGERALLRVPAAQLLRLRANPFFGYVEERLVEVVDDLTGTR